MIEYDYCILSCLFLLGLLYSLLAYNEEHRNFLILVRKNV